MSGPTIKYKFRAEALKDVAKVFQSLPVGEVTWWTITPLSTKMAQFPGCVCELWVRTLSLEALSACMQAVEDGHVMAETVALIDDYTGERMS